MLKNAIIKSKTMFGHNNVYVLIYKCKYRHTFTLSLLKSAECVNIWYSVKFSCICHRARDHLAGLDSHTHSHSSGTSKSRGSGRSLGTLKQKTIILWVLACDQCAVVTMLMWYSQPLLCLLVFQGARRVQEHQGLQGLQGRQQGQCYHALPTEEHKVIIHCDDCVF